MSIWTSDRPRVPAPLTLALFLFLAGCGVARFGGGSGGAERGAFSPSTASRSSVIDVAGRDIVIKGPPGFCVDKSLSQIGGDTAFVLLGNCRAVSPRGGGGTPAVRALLTASISNAGEGGGVSESTVDMDRFFRSETGRTALSRESDPGTVTVMESFESDGMYFLRARDTSPGIVPGAADDYWRAYFDLSGQIASVSVIGFTDKPLSPEKGLSTLRQFANLIREENGVEPAPVQTASLSEEEFEDEFEDSAEPRRQRRPTGVFWSVGILRRLLN